MLKKKVIQGGLDVQKSDGTSALTVDDSTGGVTLGILSAGNIRSGTYTPSVAKKAGTPVISAQTVQEFRWVRIGNIVNISGCVSIDPDVGGYLEIKFTLPTDGGSNNFSSAHQGHGVASVHQLNISGSVFSISGERTLFWGVVLGDGSARDHTITAQYDVV